MKRIVTVFGLISGIVVSLIMIMSLPLMRQHSSYSMLVGYASMLLAFIFVFIAIKSYRDKHRGGTISFAKAFMTGLWIAIISSACYTITWIIIYKGFYPDFMEQYSSHEKARLLQSGKSAAEIAKELRKMDNLMAFYSTWPGLILMTLVEILPVGIIVSLISALILKRKTPSQAGLPQTA
jgi:amino acid transporter